MCGIIFPLSWGGQSLRLWLWQHRPQPHCHNMRRVLSTSTSPPHKTHPQRHTQGPSTHTAVAAVAAAADAVCAATQPHSEQYYSCPHTHTHEQPLTQGPTTTEPTCSRRHNTDSTSSCTCDSVSHELLAPLWGAELAEPIPVAAHVTASLHEHLVFVQLGINRGRGRHCHGMCCASTEQHTA